MHDRRCGGESAVTLIDGFDAVLLWLARNRRRAPPDVEIGVVTHDLHKEQSSCMHRSSHVWNGLAVSTEALRSCRVVDREWRHCCSD
jgi:hypothetical protein